MIMLDAKKMWNEIRDMMLVRYGVQVPEAVDADETASGVVIYLSEKAYYTATMYREQLDELARKYLRPITLALVRATVSAK